MNRSLMTVPAASTCLPGHGVTGGSRHEEIIPVPGGWLAAVLDVPVAASRAVVIICHGLTGDRTGPQRLLAVIATELARASFLCVRFDFRGSGDSSGTFTETSFAGMQADLEAVIDWTQAHYPVNNLVLAGLSIGGVVPALVAPRQERCQAVILLSSDLIEDVQFDAVGLVDIRGGQFYLQESFFRERELLRPRTQLAAAHIPTCVFYGARDRKMARSACALRRCGFTVGRLAETDHLFEDEHCRLRLGKRIVAFLSRSVG